MFPPLLQPGDAAMIKPYGRVGLTGLHKSVWCGVYRVNIKIARAEQAIKSKSCNGEGKTTKPLLKKEL